MNDTFTSTGLKYFRHTKRLTQLRDGCVKPISLQLALTEKCNLSCSFCSVKNRDKYHEWEITELLDALFTFSFAGIKTCEITGGGEPLLYHNFDVVVNTLYSLGLKIGLITNGTLLKNIDIDVLNKLSWIRISLNTLDYIKYPLEIPNVNCVVGGSYVFDKYTDKTRILKMIDWVKENNLKYVRVVPDCSQPKDSIDALNEALRYEVPTWGDNFFYQAKSKNKPSKCYIGCLKPFLYPDGYVYPCSSTVLNETADSKFNEKFRWFHWGEARKYFNMDDENPLILKTVPQFDCSKCDGCVFTAQNTALDYVINKQDMEDFV